jgi:hypothetical protein
MGRVIYLLKRLVLGIKRIKMATKETEQRILELCSDYKKKMERLVKKSKGAVTGISLQFGDAPPIVIAGEMKEEGEK